jgi:hypothetical protein
MFKRDNFFFGMGLSIILTAAIVGLLYLLNISLMMAIFHRIILKPGTMLMIAISFNLLPVNYYTSRHANKTAKGIMVVFLLCAGYIVVRYFSEKGSIG